MRIFITGAAGFLGSHFAEAFSRRGDEVIGLVRATSRTDFLASLGVKLVQAPLSDVANLCREMAGVDVVVHAAAKVEAHGCWEEFMETTVNGSRCVLEAASHVRARQFIHISSVGVYGRPPQHDVHYDESGPYGLPYRWSHYARAKIKAESIVREAHRTGRIATTILRPTWVYGPRDTTIFGRVVFALRTGRMKWIGDGNNILNLISVTDVAKATVLAASTPASNGQVYNVADDEHSVSQRHFITRICELLNLPLPKSSISYRAAHNLGFAGECVAFATRFRVAPPATRLSVLLLGGRRRFNNQKLRSELGWKPEVPFDEGIRKTVEWFRSVDRP